MPRPRATAQRRRRRAAGLQDMARIAVLMGTVSAQAGGASSSGSDVADVNDPVMDGEDTGEAGSQGLAQVMKEVEVNKGLTVLTRRRPKFWDKDGTKLCNGRAFVLSKDGEANGNCLPAMTAKGFSCTCIKIVKENKDNPFVFYVKRKPATKNQSVKVVSGSATLDITHIAPMFFGQLPSVSILGEGPAPEDILFMNEVSVQGVTSNPALESTDDSKSKLTSAWIRNINLKKSLNTRFFPVTLNNLTLTNCNIDDTKTDFLTELTALEYLNLEYNAMTQIPSGLFTSTRLKEVRLTGNKIASPTVTEEAFLAIQRLKVFELRVVSNCTGGVTKQAKGIQFCIATKSDGNQNNQGGGGSTTSEPTAVGGTNKFLLVGVIAGCVVVVVLLFLVVRKRRARIKEDAFIKHTTSAFEDTLSFDHSSSLQHQSSVSSTLLNDPIIITHRIPYNDIKIATCISRGGFGLVYSGTFNRRRVAIKKIRSDINADMKHIEMFLKEICLMASLSHPRVVEFIGVSWDSLRNLCAVTEFMERGDLRDVLQGARARNARLSWDSHKSHIAMHVAEALTYLHSLSPKVIHRDLKSKNILIDNEMTAKLSDFGVSRERHLMETHMTAGIGTAFWIAPEVLLGMDYDERADIFSFGVVLSEIDTEDYPYWNEKNPTSGGKQQENVILRMVATGALRPEFSPSCPKPILELADACLEVDPAKRPTAAQLVYALHQVIRSSPLTPASDMSPL